MKRRGDWIQAYTGRKFWPLDPRPEEIFIEDIAHHLALRCLGSLSGRFCGAAEALRVVWVVLSASRAAVDAGDLRALFPALPGAGVCEARRSGDALVGAAGLDGAWAGMGRVRRLRRLRRYGSGVAAGAVVGAGCGGGVSSPIRPHQIRTENDER